MYSHAYAASVTTASGCFSFSCANSPLCFCALAFLNIFCFFDYSAYCGVKQQPYIRKSTHNYSIFVYLHYHSIQRNSSIPLTWCFLREYVSNFRLFLLFQKIIIILMHTQAII